MRHFVCLCSRSGERRGREGERRYLPKINLRKKKGEGGGGED